MLTSARTPARLSTAVPHWSAGIDLLQSERTRRSPEAPFLCLRSLAGVMGALRSAAPLSGKVNPVASATLLIDLNGGGSQPSEDHTMSKPSRPWYVPGSAARTVHDLNFTALDNAGRINWWAVTPPRTDYWHAHEMLGRAYAFELLDLIHNPKAEPPPPHALGYIASAIVRRGVTMPDGLYAGFFNAISEYLITGEVNR